MFSKICDNLTLAIVWVCLGLLSSKVLTSENFVNNFATNEEFDDKFDEIKSSFNNANSGTIDFANNVKNIDANNEDFSRQLKYLENPERILRSKVNVLARLLKIHVDRIRDVTDQVELVFLVDASASVGVENFRSELNFVRKLLSDFTVEPNATRVALVTFAGRRHIVRRFDQISRGDDNAQKCQLLNKQLSDVSYTGGGTYTRGALLEALAILQNSREGSEKVIFLITDGFSNSGDPRPAAKLLKNIGATIFTFGIRTGNIEELHDIASEPGYTHSYLLDSFPDFEALARRALHRDLKAGRYVPVRVSSDCNWLCSSKNTSEEMEECCDELATCACGTATGHYACLCPRGYFGSGLKGFCQPCPNGTFDPGEGPIDSESQCTPCTNVNHVTVKVPATSPDDCVCAPGFITDGQSCEAIRCPKLSVPENGYFVKASACSNVVNAACGLRCRIGFNLIGDSIRLCRKNGIWSGTEPQCLLKTCAALRAPIHGLIRCEHDVNERKVKKVANLLAYPIDTRCRFKCDAGFQLRGSKVRNCLPLSRWDGLKVTCKQIKCEPLRRLANGNVTPELCIGTKKLSFATNCTFSCNEGFALVGPKIRHCTGKNGVWSQRHTVAQCIDKTPPSITCPMNSTWETLAGKNYAMVNWSLPLASDNSGNSPNVWSKPHVKLPWKAKIGIYKMAYVAQDSSGNKAKCKFTVRVVDKEPPTMENCQDPPIFLTAGKPFGENVTWTEPIFHDNSGEPVKIVKSHEIAECDCPVGETRIFYDATDRFDNSARCVINVTVEDACQHPPVAPNGRTNCEKNDDDSVKCVLTCEDGYGFATESTVTSDHDETMTLTCGQNLSAWNNTFFPECTATEVPKSIGRDLDVILQGNSSFCDNSTIIRQLSDEIAIDLTANMFDLCGNEIDCNLVKYDPKCDEEIIEELAASVLNRRKRAQNGVDAHKMASKASRAARPSSVAKATNVKTKNKSRSKRKKAKIEIKFRFIGKIIAENRNNPKLGIKKLREKIDAMTKSGQLDLLNDRTNREIAKLALNLKTFFKEAREICDVGRVLKKHNCTECPMGTFHNTTRDQCQACPFGEYQNSTATINCVKCPLHTYTRKMHSKKISDCLPVCKPGFFSRRKIHQVSSAGLEPCTSCDIGSYQSDYGKTFCHVCQDNKTTSYRGSVSSNDCFDVRPIVEDPCETMPCFNAGNCSSENGTFTCDCPETYVGSTCERRQEPCESSPCLNEGSCKVTNTSDSEYSYFCDCKTGYTGRHCQIYIDECELSPCQNGGTCVSTAKDFNCLCQDGFEGDFCETIANHCEPWTCEEGSTCVTVDGTWKCLCKPGFLGLRCNLLPCDWIPCNPNAICVDSKDDNATRDSYRCTCPDGYEGEDCAFRINHCVATSCLNGGKCTSGLLNYTCDCPFTHVGIHCETELSSDFVLNFAEVGTNHYVIMKGPKKNITELTVCLWLQSVDTFNYGTVLSYATQYQDNALTLTDYNGFVLYVNGEKVVTDITLNDGYWHFLCIDWRSEGGTWNAYVDGILRDRGTRLANNSVIIANGTFVIGQEQDRLGGGFSASEAFLGRLSYLDIWDNVLDNVTITRMRWTCDDYHGTIVAWAQTRQHTRGNVEVQEGIFCRGCPSPKAPASGYVNASVTGTEISYTCEIGYSIRLGNRLVTKYRRKCLKHGDWEGQRTPQCTRVKCGHPGFFPRGRIGGRSFVYGDEIRYECDEGYELRGNPHRICKADGRWSGIQPICIGTSCRNLLAPENGDIEYIIEEHERDDVSILQVGQQLEFKCEMGFRLAGERYLTCLETGKWDHKRPTCVPTGCRPPELIQHGYMSTKQRAHASRTFDASNETFITSKLNFSSSDTAAILENEKSSIYDFGDVTGFTCHVGYKFLGNRHDVREFRVECSTNGSWSGHVPDCVRTRCPLPSPVQNGRLFVITENETSVELSDSRRQRNIRVLSTNRTSQETNDQSNESAEEIDLFEKILSDDEEMADNDYENIEYLSGTKIIIFCNPGHGSGENASMICLESEKWSLEKFETCPRRECPSKDHPVVNFFLSKILVRANESQNSYENSNKIVQSASAILRGTLGRASFLHEGNYYEDEFVLACENNTRMNLEAIGGTNDTRDLRWRCEEQGKWRLRDEALDETNLTKLLTSERDFCQPISCLLTQEIPSNAYVVNTSEPNDGKIKLKINGTILFGCRSGYDIVGSDLVTCSPTGSWSTFPTCRPVACKNPPKLSNALLANESSRIDDHVFGKTINYKCTRGYRIFGQASAKCLANGKWSRIQGKCSKISCGKPKIPPGVTVYGRSYLYQEQLAYKCPNGVTKGSITCKSDGKWSEAPACNFKH